MSTLPVLVGLGMGELDEVFELQAIAQEHAWPRDAVEDELGHPQSEAVGLRVAGELVAWMAVREQAGERWVFQIAVHPAARRRGYARQLLRTELGPLWLEVRASNVAALSLYAQEGFVQIGRRPRYYPGLNGGPREDAVIMKREPREAAR